MISIKETTDFYLISHTKIPSILPIISAKVWPQTTGIDVSRKRVNKRLLTGCLRARQHKRLVLSPDTTRMLMMDVYEYHVPLRPGWIHVFLQTLSGNSVKVESASTQARIMWVFNSSRNNERWRVGPQNHGTLVPFLHVNHNANTSTKITTPVYTVLVPSIIRAVWHQIPSLVKSESWLLVLNSVNLVTCWRRESQHNQTLCEIDVSTRWASTTEMGISPEIGLSALVKE